MGKPRPVPPGGGGHRPPDHKTGGNNTYPLRTTTDKELQEIITEINNHPRKHLGQATPAETYQRHTPPQCRPSDLNTVTGILVARSARVDVPAGTSAAAFPTLPKDVIRVKAGRRDRRRTLARHRRCPRARLRHSSGGWHRPFRAAYCTRGGERNSRAISYPYRC